MFFLSSVSVLGTSGDLDFVPNQGQWPADVLFVAELGDASIVLESDGIVFNVWDGEQFHDAVIHEDADAIVSGHRWKMKFVNSNNSVPVAETYGKTKYHYYHGRDSMDWVTNIQSVKSIIYLNFYDGIDLRIFSIGHEFKYEFNVSPFADPSQISWEYEGISPSLQNDGRLEFETGIDNYFENAPQTFQGKNRESFIGSRFKTQHDTWFFELSEVDDSKQIVIDPGMIISSFVYKGVGLVAGESFDFGTITTTSASGVFIETTIGAYNSGIESELRICKLNQELTEVEWVASIGQSSADKIQEIKSNELGIYFLGSTSSDVFPMLSSSFDSSANGGLDLFLMALSHDGSELIGSTYWGGENTDGYGTISSSDPSDEDGYAGISGFSFELTDQELYVVSTVRSLGPDYENIVQIGDTFEDLSNFNIAVFSMNLELTEMPWCKIISSDAGLDMNSRDVPIGLKVLEDGNIMIAATSDGLNLPTTSGAYQESSNGTGNSWIAKFSAEDGEILAATYFGGAGNDSAHRIAQTEEGAIYAIGLSDGELPLFENSLNEGNGRLWIAKFNDDLSDLQMLSRIGEAGEIQCKIQNISFGSTPCGDVVFAIAFNVSCEFYGLDWPLVNSEPNPTGKNYVGGFNELLDQQWYGALFGGEIHWGNNFINNQGQLYLGVCVHDDPPNNFHPTPGVFEEVDIAGVQTGISKIPLARAVSSALFRPEITTDCGVYEFTAEAVLGSEQYLWDFGDSSPIESGTYTVNHQYSAPGEYNVQLVTIDSTSCNYSDTLSVILSIPEVDPNPIASWDVLSFDPCDPSQELQLQFSGSNADSIEWSFMGEVQSNDSLAEFSLDGAGTYQVQLIARNSECNTESSLVESFEIQEAFEGELSWTEIDPCTPNQSIHLEYSTNIPATWTWHLPDGNAIVDAENVNYLLDDITLYEFEVVATDSLCGNEEIVNYSVETVQPLLISWEHNLLDSCALPQELNIEFTGQGADNFQWFDAEDIVLSTAPNLSMSITEEGSYQLKLIAENEFCEQRDSLFLEGFVYQPLNSSLLLNTEIDGFCNELLVTAFVEGEGIDSIYWYTDLGQFWTTESITLSLQGGQSTVLYTEVFNEHCLDTAFYSNSVSIDEFIDLSDIHIPNVFSPQNDGVNDEYFIPELSIVADRISNYHLQIFNRWGGLVQDIQSVNQRWDGSSNGVALPEGVYMYILNFTDICTTENYRYSGNIELVR